MCLCVVFFCLTERVGCGGVLVSESKRAEDMTEIDSNHYEYYIWAVCLALDTNRVSK